mmetsp:Transcript_60317/g.108616  ORF Transcript_60317/g.108616 Transcript_60317/m.108616 type:complete len:206 (-) Transcript_60317:88-705(-)
MVFRSASGSAALGLSETCGLRGGLVRTRPRLVFLASLALAPLVLLPSARSVQTFCGAPQQSAMLPLRRLARSLPGNVISRRYTSIPSSEAIGMLETGEWAYLDVRGAEEAEYSGVPILPDYGEGYHLVESHVVGPMGKRFDPQAWLPQVEAIFPDKASKLVVGCAAGIRSKAAAEVLEQAGYTEVYELADGFGGWKGSGLPVKRR